MTAVAFLLPPIVACLILTGIHAYLGIHVISRGVIFVDIALAQIAALGITVALAFGFPAESQPAYLFALGFTFFGSAFFALFRINKIPQEAVIGVSFAIGSALAILIADSLPHGSEHLKFLLSGSILWVSWGAILKIVFIYAAMALLHYVLRRPLLLISTRPEEAEKAGLRLWFWDFLFYITFGIIITSSVQIGGILLVFSFLIVPALCSMIFREDIRGRLLLGWLIGFTASLIGILLSFWGDYPTGPMIVTACGILFGLSMLISQRKRRLSLHGRLTGRSARLPKN